MYSNKKKAIFERGKNMKRVLISLIALAMFSIPLTAFAADPLSFPMREGSDSGAHKHNEEGIMSYQKGHYDEALKHFQMSARIDSKVGASHYNMALSLDKLGKHGDATMHFKCAKMLAQRSKEITESRILKDHIGH